MLTGVLARDMQRRVPALVSSRDYNLTLQNVEHIQNLQPVILSAQMVDSSTQHVNLSKQKALIIDDQLHHYLVAV